MWATLVKHAGIAADIVALFHARFDPRRSTSEHEAQARRRLAAAYRGSAGESRQPRRRPHPAPLRQRGAVGDPHQFLSARQARPGQGADRDQVRQQQARRTAAAAAALRDLRLFAARRGRASALRQGRARRHPLVGPAAGFPHRSARPGEGAAGQERGDRAGRRQRRLRAEADAERRRPARQFMAEGIASYKMFIATLLDITDNHRAGRQDRAAGQMSCATTATIRIWSSPPTRAPRRSPTSPTPLPSSTATGSATPSPRAARPATTTRRWASPRAAPGNR